LAKVKKILVIGSVNSTWISINVVCVYLRVAMHADIMTHVVTDNATHFTSSVFRLRKKRSLRKSATSACRQNCGAVRCVALRNIYVMMETRVHVVVVVVVVVVVDQTISNAP